ncbi:MAG: hypothetical protein LBV68_09185 [Spirochaetaceae bacterium]|jgi:hypothetical protein|nr:hypothetical protein [Spirochaetaceae bacterium]
MIGFLEGASLIFWIAAIFGTVLFILRVALFVFGGFGTDTDMTSQGDISDSGAGDVSQASDAAFKLLSLNSITGFIAMFGWAGLAAYSQHRLSFLVSLGIAIFAGCIVIVLTASLVHFAMKLKSPGEVFTLKNAVGKVAEVYLEIPAGYHEPGRIIFTVNGAQHEADALCENGQLIKSFERVTIIRVLDPRTVLVAPLGG